MALSAPSLVGDSSWRQLVPWLDGLQARGYPGSSSWSWLDEAPLDTYALGTLPRACRQIGLLVIQEAFEKPLLESLPTLPSPTLPYMLPPLSVRAWNVLTRWASHAGSGIETLSPQEVLDMRNVGSSTVVEIIRACVQLAATPVSTCTDPNGGVPVGGPAADQISEPEPDNLTDPRHEKVLDDLLTIARWQLLRGDGRSPIIQPVLDDPAPELVTAAQSRLALVSASDLMDPSEAPNVVAELDAYFQAMSERELSILRRRFLGRPPETLDGIGSDLSLTRERVRQLEQGLVMKLRKATKFGGAIGDLLAVLRAEIQSVVPLTRLIARHPNLAAVVSSVDLPLWFVLDRIDEAFEVIDGWAAAPTVDQARARTRDTLEDLDDQHGLVLKEDLATALGNHLDQAELSAWLDFCGYPTRDGYVLVRSNSIIDRAIATLALEHLPLTGAEIAARMPDRSPTSIKNALALDDRIARTDRDKWALAEWGHETYTSIRDLIGRTLDRSSGVMRLDDLVEELTSKFDVSASSIQAYASAPPYAVRAGMVRKHIGDLSTLGKLPSQTRRLYRRGRTWCYRFTVSEDHLRGSGFAIPRGVVDLVNCRQGQSIPLTSPNGLISLRWTGIQPNCGSVKSQLRNLGAKSGDEVFLVIDPSALEMVLELVPTASLRVGGLTAAAALMAIPGQQVEEGCALLPLFLHALDLPESADAYTIAGALRDRGEQDLFDRIISNLDAIGSTVPISKPAGEDGTPDVDSLMSLMGL